MRSIKYADFAKLLEHKVQGVSLTWKLNAYLTFPSIIHNASGPNAQCFGRFIEQMLQGRARLTELIGVKELDRLINDALCVT